MDFFDFAPKTDEELAASSTKEGDIDSDLAAKAYEIKDDLVEGDDTLLEKPEVEVQPEIKQEVKTPKVEQTQAVSDLGDMFEDISDELEANDMLFLPEDATYEPTVQGLKELLKDNFTAMKAKLEEETNQILSARLAEIEGSSRVRFSDMSTDDVESAELMLTKWYEATGLDEDEIEEKITEWKELGLLSKEAKAAQKFLIRQEKEQEQQLKEIKLQEERQAAYETEQYITNLKQAILNTDEVLGIKPTPKQKKEFIDYLFKTDRSGKTQAMLDSEDESKRLKLTWMQFLDVNAKTLETTARTKVVNDIEKKHRRFTSIESTTRGVTRRESPESTRLGPGVLDFWSSSRSDD